MSSPVIVRKVCNCLVPEAEADLSGYSLVTRIAGVEAASAALEAVLAGFRGSYGGLWVGGTVELTAQALSFRPNAVNRAFHKGDYSFTVPLQEIVGSTYERGFVTSIVVVATRHGRFKLRCYGARRFREILERTRAAG